MTTLTLYGKPGCHLCDEARVVLVGMRAELGFELEEIDVTLDPRLHAEYGERIPVVELDGSVLAHYFVDPKAIRAAVDRVQP
jgi:glutaredoxin